ncbi:MAG: hypothetical protein AAFV80_01095 [Bacteroidota bacterium]
MKTIIPVILLLLSLSGRAQDQAFEPVFNLRVSALLFPFTPLVTAEVRTVGRLTLQLESNFYRTHGFNIKYYTRSRMSEHFVFVGSAFVTNKLLREDLKTTVLPYTGYGYSYIFGDRWMLDGRIGIGPTVNADQFGIYPVAKVGIGRQF